MYNRIKINHDMILDIQNGLYNVICGNIDCDRLIFWKASTDGYQDEITYSAECYCGMKYFMEPITVKIEVSKNTEKNFSTNDNLEV